MNLNFGGDIIRHRKRSEWDFSRMLIVMSVKFTLRDELLELNSALELIFSVMEDQYSGGQRSLS